MVQLNKISMGRFYFVKDGVIFKIAYKSDGDSCASQYLDNLPVLTLTLNDVIDTYYLDSLIECGDTVEGNVFNKTIHSDTEESSKPFGEYYVMLCEEEIGKNIVKKNLTYEQAKANPSKLGVPNWMLIFGKEGEEGEVVVDERQPSCGKIRLTEENWEDYKKDTLIQTVKDSANNLLSNYGYKVTKIEIGQ